MAFPGPLARTDGDGAEFADAKVPDRVPLGGGDEVVVIGVGPAEVLAHLLVGDELLAGEPAILVLVVFFQGGVKAGIDGSVLPVLDRISVSPLTTAVPIDPTVPRGIHQRGSPVSSA